MSERRGERKEDRRGSFESHNPNPTQNQGGSGSGSGSGFQAPPPLGRSGGRINADSVGQGLFGSRGGGGGGGGGGVTSSRQQVRLIPSIMHVSTCVCVCLRVCVLSDRST